MDQHSGMMTNYSSCWSSPNNTLENIQCGSSFLQSTGSRLISEGQIDVDVRRRMQQNKRLDDGWTQIPLMRGANWAYSPYMNAASYAIRRQMLLRSHYLTIQNPNTFNTLQAKAHQTVSRPQPPSMPNNRAQALSNIEENDQHLAGQEGQNENDTGLGMRNGIDLACNYEPPSWLLDDQFNTSEANNSALFTPAKFSTLQDNIVQSAGVEEIPEEDSEKNDPKESRLKKKKKKKRKKLVPKVMREDQPTKKPKTVTPKPAVKRKYVRRKGVIANSTPTDVEQKIDVYSTSARNSARRSLKFDSSFQTKCSPQHSVVVSDVVTFDNNNASENLTNFQDDTRRAKIRGNLRWLAIIGKEQVSPETIHETKVPSNNLSCDEVPMNERPEWAHESWQTRVYCSDVSENLVDGFSNKFFYGNQVKGNSMQPTMTRRAQIRLAHVMSSTSKQISRDEVEKTHTTCHDESSDEAHHHHNRCIACQYLGPIIQKFSFLSIRDDCCDTVEDLQPQNVLVPYNGGGMIVPYEGPFIPLKKRLPRAKVELDSETNRVWMLLMGKECDAGHEQEDKEKWWEEQRHLFKGRVESFISRMHLVQGDRQFSPWKGSVVDSVVGVFLTQNVSDHLSSSAFLSVVARFPPRPRVEIKEQTPKNDDTINESTGPSVVEPYDKVNMKEKTMDGHNNNESGSGSQEDGHNDEKNPAEQVEKVSQEGSLLSQNCIISSQSSSESPTQLVVPLEQAPQPDYDIDWLNEDDTLGGSNPFMDLLQMAHSSQDLYHGESIFSGDGLNIRTCFSEDKKQPMLNEHNDVCPSSATSNSFKVLELANKTCEEKVRADTNAVNAQEKPAPLEKEYVIPSNAASENSKRVPPEAAKDGPKTGKKKTEKPKKTSFDWESLRREVCCDGKNKERHPNAYDSVDWEAVRNADVKEISNTIRARGMNNLLAERIKDFLNRVKEEHGSIDLEWLRDVPPEKARDFLLSIRGLGLKSTECVRLLTLHHMAFPVDTNVGRICVRLGWVPLQPLPESLQLHLLEMYPMLDTIQKYIWPRLCKFDQRTLYELHYQMITFGKVFCTKSKPNCNACPLKAECKHFASAFASARLALKGPEDETPSTSTNHIIHNISPNPANYPPLASQLDWNSLFERKHDNNYDEPIVELPPSPERDIEDIESMADDVFYDDPDDIPTIDLNVEQFKQNLQDLLQCNDKDIEDSDMSKALVALTPYAASIPQPKLKNVSRLRTEHLVYELPDDHPVLEGMDQREADDPSPYLFAIWTPGENVDSMGQPSAEEQSQTVKGTVLIPCRTATKGSFPLNGTYFQVNEVFADHSSSLVPVDVSRESLWKLPRRTVYFGTSVTSIFRGLTTEGIQQCFWKGFVCVRGFDHKSRTPRPLIARLHFPASKVVKNKKTSPME